MHTHLLQVNYVDSHGIVTHSPLQMKDNYLWHVWCSSASLNHSGAAWLACRLLCFTLFHFHEHRSKLTTNLHDVQYKLQTLLLQFLSKVSCVCSVVCGRSFDYTFYYELIIKSSTNFSSVSKLHHRLTHSSFTTQFHLFTLVTCAGLFVCASSSLTDSVRKCIRGKRQMDFLFLNRGSFYMLLLTVKVFNKRSWRNLQDSFE